MGNSFKLTTPVVFCTFNRPDQTKQVFERIKEAKPTKLYLVSDAAREGKQGELEKVNDIRSFIETSIDWECEFKAIYAHENMGCAKRISSALDEVFSVEERAIILEDDCYMEDSFFEFCQFMLDYYEDNDEIMSIGTCPVIKYSTEMDYLFTKVFFCCGWATWRRSWKLFDLNLTNWEQDKKNKIFKDTLFTRQAYWNYMAQFQALHDNADKFSWAYQFEYASILNNKLNVVAAKNQIKNLGFCADSTHTDDRPSYYNVETEKINLPVKIRDKVSRDVDFDKKYYEITQKSGFVIRLKQLIGLDINKSVFAR